MESPVFVEERRRSYREAPMAYGGYGRSNHNKNGIGGPRETAYEGEEIVLPVFPCCAMLPYGFRIRLGKAITVSITK